MKSLITIWAAVVLIALGFTLYVDSAINEAIRRSEEQQNSISNTSDPIILHGYMQETYNPQQTINGNKLQGGN